MDSLVWNAREAAKLLNLSKPSFYLGIKRGEIPSIKVGHRILIPKVALQKILEDAGKGVNKMT